MTQRGPYQRSVTLIELMAVVTLLALAVGVTTVQAHGVSERAQLRSAATQIESVYRLALTEAVRSGKPRRLVFQQHSVAVHKPMLVEGVWTWSRGSRFRLVRKVRIVSVMPWPSDARIVSSDDAWPVLLRSGSKMQMYRVELALGRDYRASLYMDGYGSRLELSAAEDR